MRFGLAVLLAIVFGACGPEKRPKEIEGETSGLRVRTDPWAAVAYSRVGPSAYLGNSQIGLRLWHSGLGCDTEGNALPAFMMSNHSLLRIPHPAVAQVWIDGRTLLAEEPERYSSRVGFRSGVLRVEVEDDGLVVLTETVVHPEMPVVARRITFRCERPRSIKLWIGLQSELAEWNDGQGANWSSFALSSPVRRVSEGEKRGMLEPEDVTINFRGRWSGTPSGSWTQTRSSPKSTREGRGFLFEGTLSEGETRIEFSAGIGVEPMSFQDCVKESEVIWARRWQTDIEIEGPTVDQQAIRSFLFYAYMSPTAKLPPMALSSDKYDGHRFWDAEVWMLPVYSLVQPNVAKAATQWRIAVTDVDARIPWETGAMGDDLTPPAFREAIHVAGWVSWWLQRAVALGLADKSACTPIWNSIAEFYDDRTVERNGHLEILDVTSIEESGLRDNDLVTNLLARLSSQIVREESSNGAVADLARVRLPTDRNGVPLTFDRDPVKGYQQTAALLALYPLDWPFSREISEQFFDRFKDKVSDVGPAMSDSIHAVIAARLGRREEAYRFWQRSWHPFIRPEFMLFSERRATDDVYFATGAAGCLQSVIYGFLGLRIERDRGKTPVASKSLLNGFRLTVSPNLPQEWKSITFKNVWLPGGRFTIRANHDGAEILPGGK